MDANIKGLEFNDDDKFLIQRNDFPMKISRNLSKETESELKIYRDVTLVSAVEIDLNRVWCFQDSFSKKDINAYMEDEEFKESFFKGHYPIKTSFHDDKVTILIEAITDVIHDTEGNDGMDFSEEYDDSHYENFENVDFTALEI